MILYRIQSDQSDERGTVYDKKLTGSVVGLGGMTVAVNARQSIFAAPKEWSGVH